MTTATKTHEERMKEMDEASKAHKIEMKRMEAERKERKRQARTWGVLFLAGDKQNLAETFVHDLCQWVPGIISTTIEYDADTNVTIVRAEGKSANARYAAKIFGHGFNAGMYA